MKSKENKKTEVTFSEFVESVMMHIDSDIIDTYENGCKSNIEKYFTINTSEISKYYVYKDGEPFISNEVFDNNELINEYFKKAKCDLSAKDCATIIINRLGIPPADTMSSGSLEKVVRDIFPKYKDNVYVKRLKGASVLCVNRETLRQIENEPRIIDYIKKQIKKAENNHKDSIEWKAYEITKEKIASIDGLTMDTIPFLPKVLSDDEKTKLMVEAIYNLFFTEYDFKKYENYIDELEILDDDWDFGERYQKIVNILNARNHNNEFYELKVKGDFINAFAEIVADKILKRINEKES